MHSEYGGVVPELASRDHIQRIVPLTDTVLHDAGLSLGDVQAVAYTAGPGLAGALLVGASVARSIAWALGLPAVPVHHLEGPGSPTRRPSFLSWHYWFRAAIPS